MTTNNSNYNIYMQLKETSFFDVWRQKWSRKCLFVTIRLSIM